MLLLPVNEIEINYKKIDLINTKLQSIYRLITFSRKHLADDILDSFLKSKNNLQQIMGIRNAQMESTSEEEAEEYLKNMQITIEFIVEEIRDQRNFESEVQLLNLFRLVSPEAHSKHPHKYRTTDVQIGNHLCPDAKSINILVKELFFNMGRILNPIVKAIYFHHELIRIHPFIDGNGRTTRIAKNWMLMFNLYPPIFIKDSSEKEIYIDTLSRSFESLSEQPTLWNYHTYNFFEQEWS
ncbi:MAG: Fic family protein [Candidatus Caenarcaniphilales bacterium]|nr:Fic family protein [Candidatus Caenarcaniphilales bacterium]